VSAEFFRELARRAAERYGADRFARHFAYFKLTGDPAFRHLVESGLLAGCERLLDLGCGQGMLEALLAAAGDERERWPSAWAPPPAPCAIQGIELDPHAVRRARAAADGHTRFVHDDIRTADFGTADAIVMLDVLHYIDRPAQEAVLERARRSVAPGGVMLVRVADARPTLRFRATVALDRLSLRMRGHRPGAYHCRPLAEWIARLQALGLEVEPRAMSAGTPFANVLLVARAA